MKSQNDRLLMTLIVTISTLLLLTATPALAGQTGPGDIVEEWLLDNCDTGQAGVMEKRLTELGAVAEPYLVLALERGPDKSLTDALKASLSSRWDKRAELLRSLSGDVLGKEDLELARRLTRDEYFAMEMAAFVQRYRERAVMGLARVGTAMSESVLKGYAAGKGPLKRPVEEALKRMQERREGSGPANN